MKRVLILANSDSGLYQFRKELIEELTEKYEVYASTPFGNYKSDIQKLGCRLGYTKLLDRRGTNPKRDLELFHYYIRLLKKIKPDKVITFTIKPTVYGGLACQKERIPYISCVTGLGTAIENGGLLSILARNLYKAGLGKSECTFFENEANRDFFLREGIVSRKTKVVSGAGVNLDMHGFSDYPEADGKIKFLYVGRIMKDKGIDELLEAFGDLKFEYPHISLDIVGGYDEDYSKKIEDMQSRGILKYHGSSRDVDSFYQKADCIVLPSYHEGMSNVLQEASASGRPVISTDVPGCREVFEDEVTGFSCKAHDIASLKEAFIKFILLSHEKRAEMGRLARDKMEKEFDRRRVVSEYLSEIESL